MMSHEGNGFNPYCEAVRLSELARHALEQGRNIISTPLMNKLLDEKFEDPMLGIIAAHLILARRRPNWELLHIITRNLTKLLGQHPDVQALLVAMKERSKVKISTVECPPLLRKSWSCITKATHKRASLIPQGSIIARIANEIVLGGPWLIHRVTTEAHQEM